MFRSPYETTICRSHRMDPVYKRVKDAMIEGDLHNLDNGIYAVTDRTPDIPVFHHPILVVSNNAPRGRDDVVVMDARTSARLDRETGELRGSADFNYLLLRSQLMAQHWNRVDDAQDLLNVGDLGHRLFAKLISENLARRLNLSVDVQLHIEVMAAFYFLGLFVERGELDKLDEETMLKYAKRLTRITNVPIDRILGMFDSEILRSMYSISEFTQALSGSQLSVRLDKLSPGVLYTMLGGMWYGAHPTETVAVAMEHPPTWIAMVVMVIQNRSYRKTLIAQLLQRIDRRGDLSDAYATGVRRLLATQ